MPTSKNNRQNEEKNTIIDGSANVIISGDGYTIDFAQSKDISNDNLFESIEIAMM